MIALTVLRGLNLAGQEGQSESCRHDRAQYLLHSCDYTRNRAIDLGLVK